MISHNKINKLYFIIIGLLFLGGSFILPLVTNEVGAQSTDDLDINLANYKIRDASVTKALGIETIPVRKKSYTLPQIRVPLLKLREVNEDQPRIELNEIVKMHFKGKLPSIRIKDYTDIMVTDVGNTLYYINKASGAYTFSIRENIMSLPTTISDHREAVEIALKYVVQNNLVTQGPNETIDLLYVTTVMNAAVKVGKTEPFVEYPADYFVAFGRRYRGVPVVGSYLILRIGDDGKLFGVQKTWRTIESESGEWVTTNDPLRTDDSLSGMKIVGTVSGYIEGPVGNTQVMMGPGCIQTYRSLGASETSQASQTLLPLARMNFPLSGTRKYFSPENSGQDDNEFLNLVFCGWGCLIQVYPDFGHNQ